MRSVGVITFEEPPLIRLLAKDVPFKFEQITKREHFLDLFTAIKSIC